MDSVITAAARALAVGDALGALKRVALRNDPAALALRGIAMAQLDDVARARSLLRRAARAFGSREAVARARCLVAEAEIALVSRDLSWSASALRGAGAVLAAHGDAVNAAYARHLEIRWLVLIGRLDQAERALDGLDVHRLPPPAAVAHDLVLAGIAMRRVRVRAARAAVARAERAARHVGIPALAAEVDAARLALTTPAARLIEGGQQRLLRLDEVEDVLTSNTVVVDACRHQVRVRNVVVSLVTRPVLFAVARAMGEAWPGDEARAVLIRRAFGSQFTDDSYRARLRVEVGRLRRALRAIATIHATPRGFVLEPRGTRTVAVLAGPTDDEHAGVLALLADGESWSTSALALALGTGQRTVQRALDTLATAGKVHASGRGRARRWVAPPMPGFATTLLLPAPFPVG